MTDGAPHRRRRRRGRRGNASSRPREGAPREHTALRSPDGPWRWRTFPVFCAFATGALIMGLLIWIAPGAFYVFFVAAVFLSVFGVAHYFSRSLREYRSGDGED